LLIFSEELDVLKGWSSYIRSSTSLFLRD